MAILERDDLDGIATLTLNMPEKLNALSDGMLVAMQDALDTIADDPSVRVVIIRGAGKAFCAGHDLREMQTKRAKADAGAVAVAVALKGLFDRCALMMQRIQSIPQPVIAQVHGVAVAAGCQLVATCDLAIAADDTRFGVNGVNIGLFCSTPMVALTRNVSRKAAFEMLTTGRLIDADEAVRLGLINKAVPAADLETETRALAKTIAAKLASAVKIGKQAFYAQANMSTDDAYAFTGEVMVANMRNDDTAEGITAFLEKRSPNWD